ncbi:hypothetical protein [Psychromonas ingrahamii]|nr:hypothetical protein [Psychromonas ingrahamii]
MNEIGHYLTDIVNIEFLAKLLRAALLLILGFIFAKLISYYSTRFSEI